MIEHPFPWRHRILSVCPSLCLCVCDDRCGRGVAGGSAGKPSVALSTRPPDCPSQNPRPLQ